MNKMLKRILITVLIIAVSVGLSLIEQYHQWIKFDVASYISILPSFLFGPIYGGISKGAVDALSFVLKPEGGYLWQLTLTALASGLLCGFGWKYIKNKTLPVMPFISVFIVTIIVGLINLYLINENAFFEEYIQSANNSKLVFITVLPVFVGIIFTLATSMDYSLRKTCSFSGEYMKILCVLLPVNLLITTINTFVLKACVPSYASVPLWAFYIPRVTEELTKTIIQCYIVGLVLRFANKENKISE